MFCYSTNGLLCYNGQRPNLTLIKRLLKYIEIESGNYRALINSYVGQLVVLLMSKT